MLWSRGGQHFLSSWISNKGLSPPPGVIIVPSAGVGIVLGGYIIKKLKLGARESAKLAMICSGVSLLCFSTLFIVGCESINLGGINIPYTTGWGGKLGGVKFWEGGELLCISADEEEPRQCLFSAWSESDTFLLRVEGSACGFHSDVTVEDGGWRREGR